MEADSPEGGGHEAALSGRQGEVAVEPEGLAVKDSTRTGQIFVAGGKHTDRIWDEEDGSSGRWPVKATQEKSVVTMRQ